MIEVNIGNIIKFEVESTKDLLHGIDTLREDVKRGINIWNEYKQIVGDKVPYEISFYDSNYNLIKHNVTTKEELLELEQLLR